MRITSTANPVVRYVRMLGSPGARRDEGSFLVEGVRLVGEARRWGGRASVVLYDPDALRRTQSGAFLLPELGHWGDRVYEVDQRVLKAAAQTEHPGGVLAVLPRPEEAGLPRDGEGVGVILDGIAEPGNAGAILRAADAFGATFVASTPGSVDLFAPKVVRSAMGAHFRLPLAPRVSWARLTAALKDAQVVASEARRGAPVTAFAWPANTALVIGSEATGLSADALARIDRYVHIPMRPGAESLNAAMAASIMLFAARGAAISEQA